MASVPEAAFSNVRSIQLMIVSAPLGYFEANRGNAVNPLRTRRPSSSSRHFASRLRSNSGQLRIHLRESGLKHRLHDCVSLCDRLISGQKFVESRLDLAEDAEPILANELLGFAHGHSLTPGLIDKCLFPAMRVTPFPQLFAFFSASGLVLYLAALGLLGLFLKQRTIDKVPHRSAHLVEVLAWDVF